MHLRTFKVQGFKNFRQPVVLEDLGPINVIHGPNNVGKSNLLQAMLLLFFLAGAHGEDSIPISMTYEMRESRLAENGFRRADLFNLETPVPILLEAEIVTSPEEIAPLGADPQPLWLTRVRIALELRWLGNERVEYTCRAFETADGRDLAKDAHSAQERAQATVFSTLVAKNLWLEVGSTPRFSCIPANRSEDPDLALTLYDAKESSELAQAERWEAFVDALSRFQDVLGAGSFVVTYDRKAAQASLFYQTSEARIPLRLLGSGIQQLAQLLGTLVTTPATIMGLEEPELNLRYTLQLRFREILAKLAGGSGLFDQLFITSHSDAFEAGSHFYFMEPTPEGPRVEKRPLREVRASLGLPDESGLPDPNAALCYLSSEGVVRVPDRIRQTLGLPRGGGVVFLARADSAEMMSDATFAARFEPKSGDVGDEHA